MFSLELAVFSVRLSGWPIRVVSALADLLVDLVQAVPTGYSADRPRGWKKTRKTPWNRDSFAPLKTVGTCASMNQPNFRRVCHP